MNLRRPLALLTFAMPIAAFAQTNEFDLHLAGKQVGRDIYTVAKTRQGYKITSHLTGSFHNTDLDFKNSFSYDENYLLLDGSQTSQGTNQQMSYIPSKDRKEMTIAVAAGGRTSSRIDPITGKDLVLLPPFDVGAAQALLLEAVNHPSADNLYTLYLPAEYGAFMARPEPGATTPPEAGLPPGIHCFSALWIKGKVPQTGTLDGKPIALNTYALAFGKFRWIFFADEQNNLMQVNVSLIHASYIRANFKLDPPKQAISQ